jgi:hypothetical protein
MISIDWLFIVLRPAQEYFTYMETSPLPVKGCKIWFCFEHIILYNTYKWIGYKFLQLNYPLQNLGLCSALRAFEQGGVIIVPHLLWHEASVFPVSWEWPPHSVASYDTWGGVEDLF